MANKKKIDSFEQLAAAQQHKRPEASKEEPAISTMLDQFELWMATNWKQAIISVCVFAVAISIGIIIQGAIQRADMNARKALANAGSIAELEDAIAKHSSNKAADYARLRLAADLITANQPGDLEKARKYLLEIASSSTAESFIKIRSALDAAYILEELGKPEDAAVEFERIATLTQTPEDLRVEALYSAARLFSGLDQMMKADAALRGINLAVPAAQGSSTVYGYWASLARILDEKIHPKTAATAAAAPAAEKPAEAPAETPAA